MSTAFCRDPDGLTQCMTESALLFVLEGTHGAKSVAHTCMAWYFCYLEHCLQEPPRSP